MNDHQHGTYDAWHLGPDEMQRFARGELAPSAIFSVEAHLAACSVCRRSAEDVVDAPRLAAVWEDVVDELDRPRAGWVERLLVVVGVRASVARLLAATPALTVPWLAAVGAVVGFAVGAAHVRPAATVGFLLLAPLLPLAGVAAAYGPTADPAYEVALAAPLRGFRLFLLRTVAVLVAALLVTAGGALWLPGPGWVRVAWLLPALATTTTALALGTVAPPGVAAGTAATAWVAIAFVVPEVAGDWWAIFGVTGQLAAAAVAAAAVAVLVRRQQRLDVGRWHAA